MYLTSEKLNARDLKSGSYNDRLNDDNRIHAKFVNHYQHGEDAFVNINPSTGEPETVRGIKR